MQVTRRELLAQVAAIPKASFVSAIISKSLAQDPASINTDWFGTLLMKGLLEWAPLGFPQTREFATRWLSFHARSGRLSAYSGNRSRVVHAGGVAMTTYAGHFGLSFPCYELVTQTGNALARQVCIDVADMILHRTARNRLGLVAHDDTAEFAIPDTCYFAVTALMIASSITGEKSYRDDAIYQLRTYTDAFLDKDTGLAKTILFKEGIGKTYWTRASGWLLWAMLGVLRHMKNAAFLDDLGRLADAVSRVQDASGGFHLFLNDPSSPLETTGTAMFASGFHEAVRNGWLPRSFAPVAERAWRYVRQNISDDGDIRGAYTGWAVPAEQRLIQMDQVKMGWIPGFVLSTAAELSR
jgi:hypothetical protein